MTTYELCDDALCAVDSDVMVTKDFRWSKIFAVVLKVPWCFATWHLSWLLPALSSFLLFSRLCKPKDAFHYNRIISCISLE